MAMHSLSLWKARAPIPLAICGIPLLILLSSLCCSSPKKSAPEAPAPTLKLLRLSSAQAHSRTTHFVAGETLKAHLRIEGGLAPFSLQVFTASGPPLVSAHGEIEAPKKTKKKTQAQSEAQWRDTALSFALNAQAVSGDYQLGFRIVDAEGKHHSIESPIKLIGDDAPLQDVEPPWRLSIVDLQGRPRQSYLQGEKIAIRAHFPKKQDFSLEIRSPDDSPYMPKQRYSQQGPTINLDMSIPELARIGQYALYVQSGDEIQRLPFSVQGKEFSPLNSPTIENLEIFGGKDYGIPQSGILRKERDYQVRALIGGLKHGSLLLQIKTSSGQLLYQSEEITVAMAAPHPQARTAVQLPLPFPNFIGRATMYLRLKSDSGTTELFRELAIH